MHGDGVVILGRNTYDLPHWKRYRGGARGVLWISRDGSRTFQKFLDLPGNVTSPMLIGGRVYFVSDHEGVGNLYSVDLNGGDLRRYTDFRDFYVRNASTDGRRIVFQAGGDIIRPRCRQGATRRDRSPPVAQGQDGQVRQPDEAPGAFRPSLWEPAGGGVEESGVLRPGVGGDCGVVRRQRRSPEV